MKKIMFNDKYGLTEAVLEGTKTQTRRFVKPLKEISEEQIGYSAVTPKGSIEIKGIHENGSYGSSFFKPEFRINEIVAIAQRYNSFFLLDGCDKEELRRSKGWTNKMYVKASLMPDQIRITNIRIERLQDISYEDCLKEGIMKGPLLNYPFMIEWQTEKASKTENFSTIQDAYASLINKIYGKGTWESNPFVFVYDFELIENNTYPQ